MILTALMADEYVGLLCNWTKIYAACMSCGNSSYQSISGAHAWPQQQTHWLLLIDRTDRWTLGRFMMLTTYCVDCMKKVKVAHTRLRSVGFRSWSWFLAVSWQVTGVVNSAVGCHYFPRQAGSYPVTLKRAATSFAAWWTEARQMWTVCLRLLPDTVVTAIWTWALLRLSPAR